MKLSGWLDITGVLARLLFGAGDKKTKAVEDAALAAKTVEAALKESKAVQK